MGVPNHDLDALEQRRLALEENVLQLQKSLYHWRTWEAEYDGLRDEIRNLNDNATTDDFLAAGRDFGGSLVNEEEIQTMLGTQGVTRSRDQVVDVLGRRIDYVKQNVATMEKRLRRAEEELHALDYSRDQVSVEGEGAGFPVREIMEELDEEGNVVSSSVNTPGDQASQLLETLKKAGVENIPETAGSAALSSAAPEVKADERKPEETEPQHATPNGHASTSETNGPSQNEELDLSKPVSLVTPEDRKEPPVTEVDESPEEARLRHEMLQYGIDEVGAIVAELEMDEEGSEFSLDEDDHDIGTEDEAEDEFGRSHTQLPEEYFQQMRELEAKLNARGMYNVGKDAQSFPEEVRQEIEQPLEDAQREDSVESSAKGKKPKKRVAFADDLDIAPAPEAPAAEKRTLPPQADLPVLSDSIVERTDRAPETRAAPAEGPKKVSRFKSARSTASPADEPSTETTPLKPSKSSEVRSARKQTNAVPSTTPPSLFPATPSEPKPFSTPITNVPHEPSTPRPPEGNTLADKLVEREVAQGTAAPEPDELDEAVHRREIASEFYKIRNRMIQQQGGFVNNEEQEHEPLQTEDQPRVSKFRAARMR